MKPHEETWSANVKGMAMICNEDGHGQGVFMFDKDDRARARLAAQAPAMARLLLRVYQRGESTSGCPVCKAIFSAHTLDCDVVAVLRAAGVLP